MSLSSPSSPLRLFSSLSLYQVITADIGAANGQNGDVTGCDYPLKVRVY